MANFSIKARLRSVADALTGIGHLIRGEHNAWIHFVATLLVISLGSYFSVSTMAWIALVLAISIVWLAEGMNTAIEVLADAVSQEQNALIAKAKDVAAGAVLLTAIGAATVGALVFYPYL
ncbi:MAG: diacylglycerol kinase family protein [Pseudomonadales bacterium]|nr:diacylglycerol kinase family protein [Pseudomonadales bacterium]